MNIKTLFNNINLRRKGFTLLEIIISITIISILASIVSINIIRLSNKNDYNDSLELMNLNELERVVNEYMLDNNNYPGEANILYISTTPNWIPIDNLNNYISTLPYDLENNYLYKHNGVSYEINIELNDLSKMKNDNGDNDNKYEVGNNLFLIN